MAVYEIRGLEIFWTYKCEGVTSP